jgi:FkbM family methyltransferase
MSYEPNMSAIVAHGTRWLQTLQPHRPIGMTRVSRWLHGLLPAYQGVIRVEDNILFYVDTSYPAERELFYVGDRHRALTYFLKQHTPDAGYCLDIGANMGFYTLKFARWVGQNGRVAAFEPNPTILKRIKANMELNQFSSIDLVAKAIHLEINKVPFFISQDPVLSSMKPSEIDLEQIMVDTISIDAYMRDVGWNRLDVIKLDIEGSDCNALLGGKETLERFKPFVVFEYQQDTPEAIAHSAFELLKKIGYDVQGLILRTGQVISFDRQELRSQGIKHINVICIPPSA